MDGRRRHIPKNGGVYKNCKDAPPAPPDCFNVGDVGYSYQIGETEVTVTDTT